MVLMEMRIPNLMFLGLILCFLGHASVYAGTDMKTYNADGRLPLQTLYASMDQLASNGRWEIETVFVDRGLPMKILYTRHKGPAIWLIAGIHGEEPAPPNAVYRSRELLDALAKKNIPMVLFPLCNPVGYSRNWRYPDAEKYSEAAPGHSVGDSDHYLANANGKARVTKPTSTQAAAFTHKVLDLAKEYPPVLSVDLHEDNLREKGYVYSQGFRGAQDEAAKAIISKMLQLDYPVMLTAETRFHEPIVHGIVSGVKDGSIDELIASEKIVVDGKTQNGPAGRSVLVVETSAKMPLQRRVGLHAAIIGMLEELFIAAQKR